MADEFLRIIREIDRAEVKPERHLSIQLDDSMRALGRAVLTSGQAGTLTLKVAAKVGPDGGVTFTATHSTKLPKPGISPVTLILDEEGDILRNPSADN